MKNILLKCFCVLLLTCHATYSFGQAAPTQIVDDVFTVKDSFEGFNRGSFYVNEQLDKAILKPVAKTYVKVVPKFARNCVHGIFENLNEPYTALNNVLQGKFKAAAQDACRFVVNTVVGLGGCFDVATKVGLPKHHEDFGQTLGRWGVPSGSFVMLPLLGPSTVRDLIAKPIDYFSNPAGYLKLLKFRNGLAVARLVDTRASLLGVTDTLDEEAIDKYALVRDMWLQLREAKVRDEDYESDEVPLSGTQESLVDIEVEQVIQPELIEGLSILDATVPIVEENTVIKVDLPISLSTQITVPH